MAKPPERQYRDNDGGRADDDRYEKRHDAPRPEEKEDRGNDRDDG
jgi:hypothetical protein